MSCKSKPENNQRQAPKGERPTPEQLILGLDGNQDNKLSESEVNGPIANDFKIIDSDHDGYLTIDEIKKAEKNQGNRPPRRKN